MNEIIRILPQNGSVTLRQWDENRKLEVLDRACSQVHFANANADSALVCQVYEWEGCRVADVPNILLQEASPIMAYPVYLEETGRVTAGKWYFPVLQRQQPQDYVYTETQVLNYNTLTEKLRKLEQSSVQTINGAAPDDRGNVQLVIPQPADPDWSASEGEPGHVLNRTHWVEESSAMDTLTFDGNIEGKEAISIGDGMYLVRMFDGYADSSALLGGTISYVKLEETSNFPSGTVTIEESMIMDVTEYYGVASYLLLDDNMDATMIVAMSADIILEGISMTKGIYFLCMPGVGYVSELKTSSAIFMKPEVIHCLDPKFIRDMYYTETGTEELVPVTTYQKNNTSINHYRHKEAFGLVPGQTYIVNWEGTEYKCTAVAFDVSGYEVTLLGDYSANLDGAPATGEPFGIMECSPVVASLFGATLVQILPNGKEHSAVYDFTMGIRRVVETVHPLDPKFLPEGVPYCMDGGFVEILAETTVEVDEDGETYCEVQTLLVAGETYTVKWNGTEYTCVAQDTSALMAGTVSLGELTEFGLLGNGEPFALVFGEDEGMKFAMIAPFDGATSVTFSVYQSGATIRKLDNRCLDLTWLPNTVEPVLVPETTVEYQSAVDLDTTNLYVLGARFVAYVDGVRYACVVEERGDLSGLAADAYVACMPSRANLKHVLVIGSSYLTFISTEQVTHTLSIHDMPIPNKMPEEFLPESVENVILRSGTEGSTKRFKLTVDDTGTITATEVS